MEAADAFWLTDHSATVLAAARAGDIAGLTALEHSGIPVDWIAVACELAGRPELFSTALQHIPRETAPPALLSAVLARGAPVLQTVLYDRWPGLRAQIPADAVYGSRAALMEAAAAFGKAAATPAAFIEALAADKPEILEALSNTFGSPRNKPLILRAVRAGAPRCLRALLNHVPSQQQTAAFVAGLLPQIGANWLDPATSRNRPRPSVCAARAAETFERLRVCAPNEPMEKPNLPFVSFLARTWDEPIVGDLVDGWNRAGFVSLVREAGRSLFRRLRRLVAASAEDLRKSPAKSIGIDAGSFREFADDVLAEIGPDAGLRAAADAAAAAREYMQALRHALEPGNYADLAGILCARVCATEADLAGFEACYGAVTAASVCFQPLALAVARVFLMRARQLEPEDAAIRAQSWLFCQSSCVGLQLWREAGFDDARADSWLAHPSLSACRPIQFFENVRRGRPARVGVAAMVEAVCAGVPAAELLARMRRQTITEVELAEGLQTSARLGARALVREMIAVARGRGWLPLAAEAACRLLAPIARSARVLFVDAVAPEAFVNEMAQCAEFEPGRLVELGEAFCRVHGPAAYRAAVAATPRLAAEAARAAFVPALRAGASAEASAEAACTFATTPQ